MARYTAALENLWNELGCAELLVTDVEHGNLGIRYEEKGRLRQEASWEQEIARRLADPVNADKQVYVQYRRESDCIRVLIRDEGEGFAWEQFLPITFELGVLLSAFGAILGMLAINGLPRLHHPLFSSANFRRSSDDGFFIAVEARDPSYAKARSLLESAGAVSIEEISE